MQERLFTPGPTEVRAELLNELARPQLHHRTEEFVQLYDSIQAYLKQLLFTENPVLYLHLLHRGHGGCSN